MTDLRTLALAATPGPWQADRVPEAAEDWWVIHTESDILAMASQPDAAYIAAASPAVVLALLDVVDAAQKVVAEEVYLYAGASSQSLTALRAALARVTPPIEGHDEEVTRD